MRLVPLSRPAFWTAFLQLAALVPAQEQGKCYFPDGSPSLSEPCFKNTTSTSICCSPGSICLTNGLCQAANVTRELYSPDFLRADCTDQSWKDLSCPQICRGAQDRQNSSHGLLLCDAANDKYCCQLTDRNCCLDTGLVFRLAPGRPIRVVPERTPTSTPTQRASRNSNQHGKTAIIVGVAVGVGVLLVLSSLILVCWCLRRRSRKRADALRAAADSKTVPENMDLPAHVLGPNELDAVHTSEAAAAAAATTSKSVEVDPLVPKELETVEAQVSRQELDGESTPPHRMLSHSTTRSPNGEDVAELEEPTGRINLVTSDIIELDGQRNSAVPVMPRPRPHAQAQAQSALPLPDEETVGVESHSAASNATIPPAMHRESADELPSLQRETDLDRSAVAQTLNTSISTAS